MLELPRMFVLEGLLVATAGLTSVVREYWCLVPPRLVERLCYC